MTITASSAGRLKLIGDQTAVNRWVPVVRENKPAIVAALQDDPDALAYFLWRSAEVQATDPDKADAIECGMTDCRDCRNFRGDDRTCSAKKCPTPEMLYRRCERYQARGAP